MEREQSYFTCLGVGHTVQVNSDSNIQKCIYMCYINSKNGGLKANPFTCKKTSLKNLQLKKLRVKLC